MLVRFKIDFFTILSVLVLCLDLASIRRRFKCFSFLPSIFDCGYINDTSISSTIPLVVSESVIACHKINFYDVLRSIASYVVPLSRIHFCRVKY